MLIEHKFLRRGVLEDFYRDRLNGRDRLVGYRKSIIALLKIRGATWIGKCKGTDASKYCISESSIIFPTNIDADKIRTAEVVA